MKHSALSLLLFTFALVCFGGETVPVLRMDPTHVSPEKRIMLQPEQILELSLKSNPTTGYDWQVFLPETEVLIRGEREFRPCNEKLCGGGGLAVLRFKGGKPGRTTLIGCYYRNWEKIDLQHDQTFTVSVEVVAPKQ